MQVGELACAKVLRHVVGELRGWGGETQLEHIEAGEKVIGCG